MLRVDPTRFRPRPRRRLLFWLLIALLPLIGLLLGLFAPRAGTTIELGGPFARLDQSAAPVFLARESHDTRTTLWLLAAQNPQGRRERLAEIPHAHGWDIAAAVAPDRQSAAVLAIQPGGWDPDHHAALLRVDAAGVRPIASGFSLRGGLVWSDDGTQLALRRGRRLVIVDAASGAAAPALSPTASESLHPVALRGGALWAVALDVDSTHLLQLDPARGANPRVHRIRIADGPTREWTLSPDGSRLAFTAQHGSESAVHVVAADLAAASRERWVSNAWRGESPSSRVAADSSAPVWRADGGLTHGSWSSANAGRGIRLPLAWNADATWLALRAFSDRGPGGAGEERLALYGPDGARTLAPDGLQFVGWWNW